jgi:hypothetical protein
VIDFYFSVLSSTSLFKVCFFSNMAIHPTT